MKSSDLSQLSLIISHKILEKCHFIRFQTLVHKYPFCIRSNTKYATWYKHFFFFNYHHSYCLLHFIHMHGSSSHQAIITATDNNSLRFIKNRLFTNYFKIFAARCISKLQKNNGITVVIKDSNHRIPCKFPLVMPCTITCTM